jgi:hypothetical protein
MHPRPLIISPSLSFVLWWDKKKHSIVTNHAAPSFLVFCFPNAQRTNILLCFLFPILTRLIDYYPLAWKDLRCQRG